MSGGKYVRAPGYKDNSEYNDYLIDDMWADESDIEGQEERQDDYSGGDSDDSSGFGGVYDNVEESTAEAADEEKAVNIDGNKDYSHQIKQMQATLDQLVQAMGSNQPMWGSNTVPRQTEDSWNTGNVNVGATTSTASIRWENIQPFPNDVPANRMWEQWSRFIDRFEIAVSLSNINDPVKRAQMLYLSMGEKLQGIARAARLRPSLQEPDCYGIFVGNIESYLRSMVDVTAEHETFTNLKQEPNEPTIAFHARLMEKVRLCGYSSEDQDRFVRAQLLKGMRNKDLVKTARTFGYETLFVVQSATREEAYTAETAQSDPNQAFAIAQHHVRAPGKSQQWKRKNEEADDRWIDSKRRAMVERRNRGMGRRSRCPKCNRLFHKFGSCPAINVNCNTCGERGHFAIVCRRKIANQLRAERDNSPGWKMDENDEKVKT
ncbi:uncharacterized protein LOC134222875 [Armigeres subalbatus]|uniref:uncharacterized protein LOC134222875 n=1 Tax=Armigeres subalbatus TaxID=124917 RepID=UPI002ED0AEA6